MSVSESWSGLRAMARARQETLLVWLADAAQAQRLGPAVLAQQLGVPLAYLQHLFAGVREVHWLSDEVLQACASFLRLPVILVRCAAGDVRIGDVFSAEELERCRWQLPLELGTPELLQTFAPVSAFAGLLAGITPDSDGLQGLLKKRGAYDQD